MMEAMEDCTVVSAPKVEVQPVVAVLCPTAEDCIEPEEQPVNIDAEDLEDIDRWIINLVKEIQPEAEITKGSVKTLTSLLDQITLRILGEAKRISEGAADESEHAESEAAPSTDGSKQPPLTSLDIHKAIKKLLPGEPGDPLRPYLPAVTKRAWHLDKQSLKGVKRQKAGKGGAAVPTVQDENVAHP